MKINKTTSALTPESFQAGIDAMLRHRPDPGPPAPRMTPEMHERLKTMPMDKLEALLEKTLRIQWGWEP